MLNAGVTTGELVEALRRGLRGARERGLSREQVCDLAGEAVADSAVGCRVLEHWLGDQGRVLGNVVAVVVALARLGEGELLEMLAEASGFGLVRREGAGPAGVVSCGAAAAEALGSESEAVRVFLESVDDGRVTRGELEAIVRAVRADHQANERLVEIAKGMV